MHGAETGRSGVLQLDCCPWSGQTFCEGDGGVVSFGLGGAATDLRGDGQLVGAVAECHERSLEWLTVDGACDLDEMTVGVALNARTLGDDTAADHDPGQRITNSVTTFLTRYGA